LAAIYGDQWVWIGFDPRHKVVIYFVVGRHIQANANKLLAGIRDRSDGHVPFFTSDELKHYDAAIMHGCSSANTLIMRKPLIYNLLHDKAPRSKLLILNA
jgi:hypothetical protein